MNEKSVLIIVRFPGGSVIKYPPCNAGNAETQVWSLGLEDPLEKDVANHSSILAYYHMKL